MTEVVEDRNEYWFTHTVLATCGDLYWYLNNINDYLPGGCNGLHSVMAAHVVPVNEMRLAYGLVISLGGIPILSGMPLAG